MSRWLYLVIAVLLVVAFALPAAADSAGTASGTGSTSATGQCVVTPAGSTCTNDPPVAPQTCTDCLKLTVGSVQTLSRLDVLRMPAPVALGPDGKVEQSDANLLTTLQAPTGFRFVLLDVTVTMNNMPGRPQLPELTDTDGYAYEALPFSGADGIPTWFAYTLPRGLNFGGNGFFSSEQVTSGKRRGKVVFLIPADAMPASLSITGGSDMASIQVTVPLPARP